MTILLPIFNNMITYLVWKYFKNPIVISSITRKTLQFVPKFLNSNFIIFVYFIIAKIIIGIEMGKMTGFVTSLIFLYFYGKAIQGTFTYHKIEKAEGAIDWREPAAVIERRARAFDPFPGLSFSVPGEAGAETVKLWRAEVVAGMLPHEEERTLALLDSLTNLGVDESIAEDAGRLIFRHARQGVQFSFPDALIVATSLHHGLTLATTNARHFPVPDLEIHSFD